MGEFTIKPATRTGVKPLIGLYGKSGSGKTMSALLLARGLVGPKGRIVLLDTENGRGSIFADLIPGGYSVLDLDAPFSPPRYEEAIATAEKSADVVVVDSMSHEWSGEGGVLDWADAELEKMGGGDNNKMRSWIKPKLAHKMMVQRLLRTKCALICCLRGEEKTHMGKNPQGKNTVITDEFSSPLFDPRFIFEMLLNFETVQRNGQGGYVIPRKITHPSIAPLLPGENQQISVATGEAIAKWCAGGAAPAASKPSSELTAVKKELWALLAEKHGGDKARLQSWVTDELGIDVLLDTMEVAGLREVIEAAKKKLNP
jgi:hypothetical protein